MFNEHLHPLPKFLLIPLKALPSQYNLKFFSILLQTPSSVACLIPGAWVFQVDVNSKEITWTGTKPKISCAMIPDITQLQVYIWFEFTFYQRFRKDAYCVPNSEGR